MFISGFSTFDGERCYVSFDVVSGKIAISKTGHPAIANHIRSMVMSGHAKEELARDHIELTRSEDREVAA